MRISKTVLPRFPIVAIMAFIMLTCMPLPLLADTTYLFGKIGDFPIGAALEQNRGKLTGFYFYYSRARQIRLEGSINPDGTFRMEETTEGKKTGLFEGNVKQGRWSGTWSKAPGAAPLQFSLDENHDQLKNLTCSYDCTLKERDAAHRYTYQWRLKLAIAKGAVKELDSTQEAFGDDRDEQRCVIDLNDLKQVRSDLGIVLKAEGDDSEKQEGEDKDEKECAVQILGNADILWIRFGDSSVEGNDCRGLGSSMFCSPRAFWNDIILDRRTQKCKALR
ncbi:MAG: hypothetical protein ABFD97_13180 [Syntrophobacter sp.]